MNVLQRKTSYKKLHIFATLAFVFSTVVSPFLGATTAAAATAPQVSTGAESACAVVNSLVKCWGNNDNGQLGTGTTGGNKTLPTTVYNQNTATPAQYACVPYWWWCVNTLVAAEIPASAMGGKKVTKVSVGAKHACAIANASVYCWGDNSQGQLGRSGGDAAVPVAVDMSSSSALRGKEVIDVSASDNFTCALASDGSIACWGNNQYGQLGNGSFSSSTIPSKVFATGELAGQRGVKLAKAAGYSMCVLTRASQDNSTAPTGAPYCWGRGMGNGTIPGDTDTTLSTCSTVADTTGAPVYFNTNKPVRIGSSVEFSVADGNTYMTGLGADKIPYYWGMHGYVPETFYSTGGTGKSGSTPSGRGGTANNSRADLGTDNSTRDVASNTVTPGSFHTAIRLASASTDRARQNKKPGGDKNRNLNSNNNSINRASMTANQYNPGGPTNRGSGFSSSVNAAGSYAGVASPGYKAVNQSVGNNNNNTRNKSRTPTTPTPPCTPTAYTVTSAYTEVGTITAKRPTATTLTTSSLNTLSGNVVNNLFCAVKLGGGPFCDANGTSMNEGQTGSGYTQQCTSSGPSNVCGAVSGPQAVSTSGWLSGKTVLSLSTGASGYTCAVASDNSVGCWGINNVGQLGVGDTVKRTTPTKITL